MNATERAQPAERKFTTWIKWFKNGIVLRPTCQLQQAWHWSYHQWTGYVISVADLHYTVTCWCLITYMHCIKCKEAASSMRLFAVPSMKTDKNIRRSSEMVLWTCGPYIRRVRCAKSYQLPENGPGEPPSYPISRCGPWSDVNRANVFRSMPSSRTTSSSWPTAHDISFTWSP